MKFIVKRWGLVFNWVWVVYSVGFDWVVFMEKWLIILLLISSFMVVGLLLAVDLYVCIVILKLFFIVIVSVLEVVLLFYRF